MRHHYLALGSLATILTCACTFDWERYAPISIAGDGGTGGTDPAGTGGSGAAGGTGGDPGSGGAGGTAGMGGEGGSGGAPPVLCTIGFSDDFNDGLTAPEWTEEADGMSVSEDTYLELDIPIGVSGDAGYRLTQTTSLVDGYVSMEVPLAPLPGDDGYVGLHVSDAEGRFLRARKGGGSEVILEYYDGSTYTGLAGVLFDARLTRWWRIRNEDGATHLDVSADGTSWTSQGSVEDGSHMGLEEVTVRIHFHSRGETPLHIHADNFSLCH